MRRCSESAAGPCKQRLVCGSRLPKVHQKLCDVGSAAGARSLGPWYQVAATELVPPFRPFEVGSLPLGGLGSTFVIRGTTAAPPPCRRPRHNPGSRCFQCRLNNTTLPVQDILGSVAARVRPLPRTRTAAACGKCGWPDQDGLDPFLQEVTPACRGVGDPDSRAPASAWGGWSAAHYSAGPAVYGTGVSTTGEEGGGTGKGHGQAKHRRHRHTQHGALCSRVCLTHVVEGSACW